MPEIGIGDARVARQRGHHVERDGLDRRAAVAAVGGASADDRVGDHPVEVDADDALDGVDEAEAVGASLDGGDARDGDVADVRASA